MKILYLVRHAQAHGPESSLHDRDRSLNERGIQGALLMGERLRARHQLPEQIIVSSALRALSTMALLASQWQSSERIQAVIEPRLYEANPAALLSIVHQLDNRYNRAMLVGHNPGMTDFANFLTDDHCADFPTCGVYEARFSLDSWAELDQSSGYCELFDYPRYG